MSLQRRPFLAGIGGTIAAAGIGRAEGNGPTIGLLMTGGIDSLPQGLFAE